MKLVNLCLWMTAIAVPATAPARTIEEKYLAKHHPSDAEMRLMSYAEISDLTHACYYKYRLTISYCYELYQEHSSRAYEAEMAPRREAYRKELDRRYDLLSTLSPEHRAEIEFRQEVDEAGRQAQRDFERDLRMDALAR